MDDIDDQLILCNLENINVMGNAHFFKLLNNLKYLDCGHVGKFVTLSNYLLDNIFMRFGSKIAQTNRRYSYGSVLIVLLLLQICFCFVI